MLLIRCHGDNVNKKERKKKHEPNRFEYTASEKERRIIIHMNKKKKINSTKMGKKNSNKIITRLKIMLFQFVVIFLFSLTLPLNAICILHMILFIQTKVKCMKTIQNASTSYRSRILECIYFPTNSVERVRTSDRDSKRYSDSESNEKK